MLMELFQRIVFLRFLDLIYHRIFLYIIIISFHLNTKYKIDSYYLLFIVNIFRYRYSSFIHISCFSIKYCRYCGKLLVNWVKITIHWKQYLNISSNLLPSKYSSSSKRGNSISIPPKVINVIFPGMNLKISADGSKYDLYSQAFLG
jgi:hypothetical protein